MATMSTSEQPRPRTDNDTLFAATKSISAEHLGLEVKPTKNLCHYTSQEGVIGILKQKALYATDAMYLSDMQEVIYAINLARVYFKNKRPSGGTRRVLDMLNVIEKTESLARNLPVYVASFSEEPDLLSQWRGYCPRGSGFAVCFSPQSIAAVTQRYQWALFKCLYNEEEHVDLLRRIEEQAARFCETQTTLPYEIVFNLTLLRFGTAFKHPKFREEAEWRAVQRADGTVRIRQGPSMLIPYMDFPLTIAETNTITLASLVIGPTPYPALAKNAAQLLLHSMGAVCHELLSSAIPFRSW